MSCGAEQRAQAQRGADPWGNYAGRWFGSRVVEVLPEQKIVVLCLANAFVIPVIVLGGIEKKCYLEELNGNWRDCGY